MSFVPPDSDGGDAITGYTVTASPGGATGTGTASPIVVTGLTNGVPYVFTVTATNTRGTGAASGVSNSIIPRADQTISFTNPGAQNFGTTPTLAASASSGLTVTFTSATTGVCTITSGGALTFVTAGSCTIDADQAGDAAWLAAPTVSRTFTVNAIVPGAPTIGTATAGDAQATVSFTPPESDGGDAIQSYTVTASPGGASGTGTASPIVVTGLTNGVAYTFTVAAVNGVGRGAPSVASNAVVPVAGQSITFADPGAQDYGTHPIIAATASSGLPVILSSGTPQVCTITDGVLTFLSIGTCTIEADQAGDATWLAAPTVSRTFTVNPVPPGAPTLGTVTVGNGQIGVTFFPPADTGGSAISDYEVSLDGGQNWTSAGTTASPLTVTGLTNGTTYAVALRAVTSGGAGAASAVATAVPVTTAGAPAILSLTPGNGQIAVAFAAPTDTGGAVVTGYDYSLDSGVNWASSGTVSSPITITGLTNGTAYGVALRAVTSVGAGAASAVATAVPVTTAGAPAILSLTPGNGQIAVAFAAPTDTGGAVVTGYDYSLDSGVNWASAGTVASPITITGLTNGTTYTVTLRAVTGVGAGAASQGATAMPFATSDAPTNLVLTAGDSRITVAFAPPADTGGLAITGYDYTLDGGASWSSAGVTRSPVTITGLTNGTSYAVALRAVTSAGAGAASLTVAGTPVTTASAPTGLSLVGGGEGDGRITVAFAAPAETGGAAIIDYDYSVDGGTTWAGAGTAVSPVTITGLTRGQEYAVALRAVTGAGPGAASATLHVLLGSPVTEFAEAEEEIAASVMPAATLALQGTLTANRTMMSDARNRLIARRTAPATRSVPLGVEGSFQFDGGVLSTSGTFGGVTVLDGATSRVVSGDFNIGHDGESGTLTATMSARVAWETAIGERALLGYFLGGELSQSHIAGEFTGEQARVGVVAGSYGVYRLGDALLLDGFLTFGAGRNDLTLENADLALESSYPTRTGTLGFALTGVIARPGFELWPELSVSYGRTWIGEVGFTGMAYGVESDDLTLDMGLIEQANITFRPKLILPMDGGSVAESLTLLSLVPRYACDQVSGTVDGDACGAGAEIGVSSQSGDGLTTLSATYSRDWRGSGAFSSLQLSFEHRF